MNDQEFLEETVAVLAVRGARAEQEVARLRGVLQEIAEWNLDHNTSSDWTNVIVRKAAAALT